MDIVWENQTWSNDSQTTGPNTTIDDVLPTKNQQATIIDWASQKNAIYIAEVFLHSSFLMVGLLGNILTLLVLLYKKWTNITSRYILMALAISDTIMIIAMTFNQEFVKDLFKLDARAFSTIGCKIFYIFYRTSKMTSSWFVVFLCFERFIAVTFPLKAKRIITEQLTKIYITVNYLVITAFSIGLSFSTTVEDETCKKDVVESDQKKIFKALMLLEMILYSVAPIILMSIFTPMICLKLVKIYQKKKNLSSRLNKGNDRENQQLQDLIRTTIVLMSVVIVFILCVTPMTIFQQVKFWQRISNKELQKHYGLFMFKEISQRLEQINYSINFFLYIFNSPTFRASVFELFRIKRNRSESSTGNNSTKQSKLTNQPPANADDTITGQGTEKQLVPDLNEIHVYTMGETGADATLNNDNVLQNCTKKPNCDDETTFPYTPGEDSLVPTSGEKPTCFENQSSADKSGNTPPKDVDS